MKKILLLSLLLFTFYFSFGQTWEWAKKGVRNYNYDIGADAAGNVYVTGMDWSTGPVSLIKYDPNGNIIWSTLLPNVTACGLTVAPDGSIYFAGYSSDSSIVLGTHILSGPNMFIVKYDSSGSFIWGQAYPQTYATGHIPITRDKKGNLYITGSPSDSIIVIGPDIIYTPTGQINFFIAKCDSAGNVKWAKSPHGPTALAAYSSGLSADTNGDIYITGYFAFANIIFGSYTLTNTIGPYQIFLAKYNSVGNVLWAKEAYGASAYGVYSYGLVSSPEGNAYITGVFNGNGVFFDRWLISTTYGYNIFIAKYAPDGDVKWAETANGIDSYSVGESINMDKNGDIYIGGFFVDSTLILGSWRFPITSSNGAEIFVTKLDTSGNFVWALSAGGINNFNDANAICTDANSNVYIAGDFEGNPDAFGNNTLGSLGFSAYVAKVDTITAIKKIDTTNKESRTLGIYPNPSSGKFNIVISGMDSGISLINIYNVLGEKLYSESTYYNTTFQIDLSSLSTGIYFLKIQMQDGSTSVKKIEIVK